MSQPEQQQEVPGVQAAMTPVPDCGEHSYRGSGKLAGKAFNAMSGDREARKSLERLKKLIESE